MLKEDKNIGSSIPGHEVQWSLVYGRRIIYCLAITFLFILLSNMVNAQDMGVRMHPNNGMMALTKNDSLISDYIFSEISEFSENKAYAAKGELYGYIDTNGLELSPFIFTVANNFKNGFAVIGDSFAQGLINAKMQLVVPVRFNRVLQPKLGLIVTQNSQGFWGAYDTLGIIKIQFSYDIPLVYESREYIIVRKNKEYGVINDCNEIVFNTSYQYIRKDGIAYRSGIPLRLFPDLNQLD